MSPEEFAIADTCFLIDWAHYRNRDLLFKLFKVVYVPENVLNEVRSERTISWISRALSNDYLALYTPMGDEINEARRLIELTRLKPEVPSVDLPESLCLVIGRRRGYVVLSENRGAVLAPKILDEYKNVTVWRALELLYNAILRGFLKPNCSKPESVFEEYSSDTFHLFPSKALDYVIKEVRKLCQVKR